MSRRARKRISQGHSVVPTTRFTDPAAVDAWDHWFRWRHAEGLRDRTIDATWLRVAGAIARAVDDRACMRRYVDAFSRWQLLPDERLLRSAGTARKLGPLDSPTATLNVSAFVLAPLTRQARFDADGFANVAGLAVRLLDDALVTMPSTTPGLPDLRIGVMGFADALDLLGIAYTDAGAIALARTAGAALARGTLRGTVDLAHERGAIDRHPGQRAALWRERGTPTALVDDALRWGVRHTRLTAIQRQPRLALLANNASDALDPALPRHRAGPGDTSRSRTPTRILPVAGADSIGAQLALRAAIQPWIDAPVDYPLVTPVEPDLQTRVATRQLAESDGLCDPRFRSI